VCTNNASYLPTFLSIHNIIIFIFILTGANRPSDERGNRSNAIMCRSCLPLKRRNHHFASKVTTHTAIVLATGGLKTYGVTEAELRRICGWDDNSGLEVIDANKNYLTEELDELKKNARLYTNIFQIVGCITTVDQLKEKLFSIFGQQLHLRRVIPESTRLILPYDAEGWTHRDLHCAIALHHQAIANLQCVEISNINGDFIDQQVTVKDGSNDTVHHWMQRHHGIPSHQPILHSVSRTRDPTKISWIYLHGVKDYIPQLATFVGKEIREEFPTSLVQRCILHNPKGPINSRPLRVCNGVPRPESQGVLQYLQWSQQGCHNSSQHITTSATLIGCTGNNMAYSSTARPSRLMLMLMLMRCDAAGLA
jgi:hypothetical protein